MATGHCSRCRRRLTVPSSLVSCVSTVQAAAGVHVAAACPAPPCLHPTCPQQSPHICLGFRRAVHARGRPSGVRSHVRGCHRGGIASVQHSNASLMSLDAHKFSECSASWTSGMTLPMLLTVTCMVMSLGRPLIRTAFPQLPTTSDASPHMRAQRAAARRPRRRRRSVRRTSTCCRVLRARTTRPPPPRGTTCGTTPPSAPEQASSCAATAPPSTPSLTTPCALPAHACVCGITRRPSTASIRKRASLIFNRYSCRTRTAAMRRAP